MILVAIPLFLMWGLARAWWGVLALLAWSGAEALRERRPGHRPGFFEARKLLHMALGWAVVALPRLWHRDAGQGLFGLPALGCGEWALMACGFLFLGYSALHVRPRRS